MWSSINALFSETYWLDNNEQLLWGSLVCSVILLFCHLVYVSAWVYHVSGCRVLFIWHERVNDKNPKVLCEFPRLSSLRSHAFRTHLDGTISVLALSTRREWRPQLEPPRRYSGLGSWWSELFYNALDIFSEKKER